MRLLSLANFFFFFIMIFILHGKAIRTQEQSQPSIAAPDTNGDENQVSSTNSPSDAAMGRIRNRMRYKFG